MTTLVAPTARRTHAGRPTSRPRRLRRLHAVPTVRPAPVAATGPRSTSVVGDPSVDPQAYNLALARYVLTAPPMGM